MTWRHTPPMLFSGSGGRPLAPGCTALFLSKAACKGSPFLLAKIPSLFLVDSDNVPLIIGFEDILTDIKLVCDYRIKIVFKA
jgi:hypothetical protein